MKTLKNEIDSTDWSRFNGPKSYVSCNVPLALYNLIGLDNAECAEEVGCSIINAIGNNHAGVYYPVVLKVLDYIISIAEKTESNVCRICALSILNDILYFSPEMGNYKECSKNELERFVIKKLQPYSDENIQI